MCHSIALNTNLLPPAIDLTNNEVLHFSWDNFDLNEETASGLGTTHTTHGIAIQETTLQAVETRHHITNVPKTKERSVKFTQEVIPPSFSKIVEPNFQVLHQLSVRCREGEI